MSRLPFDVYEYPEELPGPLMSGQGMQRSSLFAETTPASGPGFMLIMYEAPVLTSSVSFIFTREQAQIFDQWLISNKRHAISGGRFGIQLRYPRSGSFPTSNTGRVIAVFTQSGIPQLDRVAAGKYHYSATIKYRGV